MLVRNITRATGIAVTALSLYACAQKNQDKNIPQNETAKVENLNKQDSVKPALTHNFLGMKVEYKSKEDSTNADKYIRKIVKDALPTDRKFNGICDIYINTEKEKMSLLHNGDTIGANAKERQLLRLEPRIDSLWNILKEKTVQSDSVNKYANKSDLEPNTEYLYGWFKKEIMKNN